jgi:hypothetical protein
MGWLSHCRNTWRLSGLQGARRLQGSESQRFVQNALITAVRTSRCLKCCISLGSKLKSLSEHRALWPLDCLHLPGLLLHSALQGLSLEKIAFAMIFKLANAAERCVAFWAQSVVGMTKARTPV